MFVFPACFYLVNRLFVCYLYTDCCVVCCYFAGGLNWYVAFWFSIRACLLTFSCFDVVGIAWLNGLVYLLLMFMCILYLPFVVLCLDIDLSGLIYCLIYCLWLFLSWGYTFVLSLELLPRILIVVFCLIGVC